MGAKTNFIVQRNTMFTRSAYTSNAHEQMVFINFNYVHYRETMLYV